MEIPNGAHEIKVKAGKGYSICTCGETRTSPFCNNSHRVLNEEKGTRYRSLKLYPDEDTTLVVFSKNWNEKP